MSTFNMRSSHSDPPILLTNSYEEISSCGSTTRKRPPANSDVWQKKKMFTYAIMAHPFVHAPIYSCFSRGKRCSTSLDVTYKPDNNEQNTYLFRGPELLGALDLRVFQGLIAIATEDLSKDNGERAIATLVGLRNLGINCNLTFLARVLNYVRPNRATRTLLLKSIQHLSKVKVKVIEHSTGYFESFQLLGLKRMDHEEFTVVMNPIASQAILQPEKGYQRVNLEESNSLKSNAARILHSRLSCLNQDGIDQIIRLELLCEHIYGTGSISASARSSTLKALEELRALGWMVRHQSGSQLAIRRPRYEPTQRPDPSYPYH